jgi:hypothetical protein
MHIIDVHGVDLGDEMPQNEGSAGKIFPRPDSGVRR